MWSLLTYTQWQTIALVPTLKFSSSLIGQGSWLNVNLPGLVWVGPLHQYGWWSPLHWKSAPWSDYKASMNPGNETVPANCKRTLTLTTYLALFQAQACSASTFWLLVLWVIKTKNAATVQYPRAHNYRVLPSPPFTSTPTRLGLSHGVFLIFCFGLGFYLLQKTEQTLCTKGTKDLV